MTKNEKETVISAVAKIEKTIEALENKGLGNSNSSKELVDVKKLLESTLNRDSSLEKTWTILKRTALLLTAISKLFDEL
ncbi:hypothetical protein MW374_004589 [Vibrio parahaemolyticus]|uniref:hypothetical protein n=1 Tax=Vibrio TaxID=662 RepID=UPI000648232F|nr:hypothetical protein [Vibrio fluvialis]EGQ8127315.1 hypothetical protein [Vibrio parahaemolyticus]EGQ9152644.1 hypothetical protein [Vibrio parahaemolyticus]EJB8530662.1 hypothetical protein [Vibrio parahaemolyticus]EJE4159552.1 hypothetical protein [Vibrio parahaemolyticus]HBC3821684.1 hypothetical protein [Vibrio parahaemolyticus]